MSILFKKLAFASLLVLSVEAAYGQITVYTTNFGTASTAASDGHQYVDNQLTLGQTTTGGMGQNGWLTNDPENDNASAVNGNYIGGSNVVQVNGTYFGSTAFSAYLGTTSSGSTPVDPGAATTYLYKPVSLASASSTYSFNVDFAVLSPATTGTIDSFGFTLLNSAGTPLLSVNSGTTVTTQMVSGVTTSKVDLGYEVGSNKTLNTNGNGITLNAVYHLTITVNVQANTFTATYSAGGSTAGIASNVSLSGQISSTSVTDTAATWTLSNTTQDANGAYTNAGNDSVIFDNYTLAIPEPSTCAMLGAGLLGLAGLAKYRARHA